jgi:hypothetical protein
MEWIKYTPLAPPPQGLKVICFNEGDCWVAYNFAYEGERYWIPCVPHSIVKNQFERCVCDEPQFWAYIDFEALPTALEYRGLMEIHMSETEVLTFDELQDKHPKEHREIVMALLRIEEGKGKENKSGPLKQKHSSWKCQECGGWTLKGTQMAILGKCVSCTKEGVAVFPCEEKK